MTRLAGNANCDTVASTEAKSGTAIRSQAFGTAFTQSRNERGAGGDALEFRSPNAERLTGEFMNADSAPHRYYWLSRQTPPALHRAMFNVFPIDAWYLDKPITTGFPDVAIEVDDLEDAVGAWMCGTYLVMFTSLCNRLHALDPHMEAFPVRLVGRSGGEDQTSSCLVHLLDDVPCMDMKRSMFTPEDDLVGKITRLVIDEQRVPPDRHLFAMAERSDLIIASEQAKALLEALDVQGMVCCSLDDVIF